MTYELIKPEVPEDPQADAAFRQRERLIEEVREVKEAVLEIRDDLRRSGRWQGAAQAISLGLALMSATPYALAYVGVLTNPQVIQYAKPALLLSPVFIVLFILLRLHRRQQNGLARGASAGV